MTGISDTPKNITEEPQSHTVVDPIFADYYYRFKQFCSFYPLREQHLANSILNTIDIFSKSESHSLSILDVGSAGGELLGEIISILSMNSGIEFYCAAVEPDPLAFLRLDVTARLLRKPGKVAIDCVQACIENVMPAWRHHSTRKFDFILCSHVFYHLKDWAATISDLRSFLCPGGKIIVILDSHHSPIYDFKNDIELVIGHHNNIRGYGDLCSAENFLALLKSLDLSYSYKELDWDLLMMSINLLVDLESVLTFLYRFPVNGRSDVLEALDNFSKKFQFGNAYCFPWREGLFIVS